MHARHAVARPSSGKIEDGPRGAGQHLLPARSSTSSPVDLDLINNTMRLPYRQRFAILLNELGAGFAGRGEDLNELIHRANPALRETDEVLKQLAAENQTLKRPGARVRHRPRSARPRARAPVGLHHASANAVGEATAERRADIERSIQQLPRFLRGAVADDARPRRPLRRDDAGARRTSATPRPTWPLRAASSARSRPPSTTALDVARRRHRRRRPRAAARPSGRRRTCAPSRTTPSPVSKNLDDLTASLDKTGGIERLMDYIFFQMTAINGFDALSHYLRAGLLVNLCSTYVDRRRRPGCSAQLHRDRRSSAPEATGNRDRCWPPSRPRSPGAEQAGRQVTAKPARALADRRSADCSGPAAAERPGRDQAARGRDRRASARSARRGASPALDGARAASSRSCSTTCWETTGEERAPQLRSAAPSWSARSPCSCVVVGVFLAYNANTGLPFVPDLRARGRRAERSRPGGRQRRSHRRRPRGRGRRRSRRSAPATARPRRSSA